MADPDVNSDSEDSAASLTTRGVFENGFWKLDCDIQGESYKAEMTLETTRLRKVIIKLKNLSNREDGITPIERIIKPNSQNRLLLTYQDEVVLNVHEIEVLPDQFDNPIMLDHGPSDDYYCYRFDAIPKVSILKSLKVFLPNNLQMCLPALDEDVRLRKIVSAHFVDYLEYCIGQKNQPDNLANSLKIARRFTPPHFQLHDGRINREDDRQFQYVAMSSGVLYPLDRPLGPTASIIIEIPVNQTVKSDRRIPFSKSLEDFPKMYPGITCRVFVYSSMIQQHEFLSIGFVFKHENESINFRMPVTATITLENEDATYPIRSTFSRLITRSTPTMGCPVLMNMATYRSFFERRPGLITFSITKEDDEAKLTEIVDKINTQLLQNAFNAGASAQNTEMFPNHVTTRRIFDILYHGTTDLTNENIVEVYRRAKLTECHRVMEYCNQAIQASYPVSQQMGNIGELDRHRNDLSDWQRDIHDEIYLQDYINTMNDIEHKPIDEYSPCVVYRFPNGGFHHCP